MTGWEDSVSLSFWTLIFSLNFCSPLEIISLPLMLLISFSDSEVDNWDMMPSQNEDLHILHLHVSSMDYCDGILGGGQAV